MEGTKVMAEEPLKQLTKETVKNKAEQIASHLRMQPEDLIDIRSLMRRFHASAKDFQQAFMLLEQPLQG